MPYKFFCVPVRDDGKAESELNAFVGNHRVLAVERRWVDQASNSYWAFCIDYFEAAQGANDASRGAKRRGKDYREILSPDDFVVFAKLRELRKEIAQADAIPVYTIFTNEQLAEMAELKVQTKADLRNIGGVGEARIEKYGSRFLDLLQGEWNKPDEASGASV